MNTHRQFRINSITDFATHIVAMSFAAVVILIASASPAAAQSRESRDIDHPVRLTSSELARPIAVNREIFYTFIAGPGELTMTLDLLQKSVGATVEITLYDKEAKSITSFYGWALAQNAREIRHIKFPTRQQVLMKISVTHSGDNYDGNFRLRITGATEFAQSASAPTPGPSVNSSISSNGGVMRVVMKDGSTQDIDLSLVQRVILVPAN